MQNVTKLIFCCLCIMRSKIIFQTRILPTWGDVAARDHADVDQSLSGLIDPTHLFGLSTITLDSMHCSSNQSSYTRNVEHALRSDTHCPTATLGAGDDDHPPVCRLGQGLNDVLPVIMGV